MVQIQKKLPVNLGFNKKNAEQKQIRYKDPIEYEDIPQDEWERIASIEDKELRSKEIEVYRIEALTIKVSLDPEVYRELGYISDKLDLKMSEQALIKEAIIDFVKNNKWMIDHFIAPENQVIGVAHSETRKTYVKVKLPGSIIDSIGYPNKGDQKGYGLCGCLGYTRQKLIQIAVKKFIEDIKT